MSVATRRLWSAFLRQTPDARATLFAPGPIEPEAASVTHVAVGPLRGGARLAWQQLTLPRLLRERGIEILHSPCYTAPLAASCRHIVTIHDLIAWTHPRLAGWRNAAHLRAFVGRGVRRAEAVCVPTEFVRRLVIERFGVAPSKMFVVPWGVDSKIAPVPREEAALAVLRRFGVDEPFALWCGCVEAKKNVRAAIHAAERAGLLLLMVGPWLPHSPAVLAAAGRGASGRRRYLGYVSDGELSALYSAATALLFPSHTEGFGLPAVEAMRCGCPVIASDAPALREVCGGAAVHVPHGDALALADVLRAVAGDTSLRESLSALGVERARRFTWAAAVERFGEALNYAARCASSSRRAALRPTKRMPLPGLSRGGARRRSDERKCQATFLASNPRSRTS